MTRPTFGRPIRAAICDPRLAIVRQCQAPARTLGRMLNGEPTPCYRCLAYTLDGCHFTRRKELSA